MTDPVAIGRRQGRVDVPAFGWGYAPGTDYWLIPGGEILTAAGILLSENGWTTTALALVEGAGADFLSPTDVGVPAHILTDATGDLLRSPPVFGSFLHGKVAGKLLGHQPSILTLEQDAAFSVASANETTSWFGWVEAGGSPDTADDAMAMIISNGSNFVLRSGAASDVGALVDNLWHVWKIVITFGVSIEWFIDDVSQGTIAIQADLWPVSFGMHTLTTNRVLLGIGHISYD